MDWIRVYNKLPPGAQTLCATLEGERIQRIRYGGLYEQALRACLERDAWSAERRCEYRDARLREMVRYCYESVPYYRTLFDNLGLDFRRVRRLEDLQLLPVLKKETVLSQPQAFLPQYRGKTITLHTSGTEGASLACVRSREADAAVWAGVWRGYGRFGLRQGTWCGYFGGRPVVPVERKKPPFWRINYPGRQILFSVRHLGPDTAPRYLAELDRRRPPWIQGYPSVLTALAGYMEDSGRRLSYVPSYITLSSENVSPAQLSLMTRVFGVRPIQNYSQTEAVASFWQRPDGRMLVEEDLAAVELLPEGDGVCRVVGTTLHDRAMPLLRYDTGDLVSWRPSGGEREILALDGRAADSLRLRDGGTLCRLSRIFHGMPQVRGAQLVQKSLDLVELRVVRGPDYDRAAEVRLQRRIREYLGNRIGWRLTYVDRLERTDRGKVRFFKSEL